VESRYAFKEGKPDGPWVLFNPNGNTIPERSGTYRNGALVD
jgi:antitoxin component YwqK of YwqJK toxin-antitoxin module